MRNKKINHNSKEVNICGVCGGIFLQSLNYCPLCNYGKSWITEEETKKELQTK